jgi:hypothetical protein
MTTICKYSFCQIFLVDYPYEVKLFVSPIFGLVAVPDKSVDYTLLRQRISNLGLISVYSLQAGIYQKVTKSVLLPNLDLELIARYSRTADQYDAVLEYSQIIAT